MTTLEFRRPAAQPQASSQRARGAADLVLPVIERLLQILDAENAQIQSRKPVDYNAFNLRKSQALLEVSRLAPTLSGAQASPVIRSALGKLRTKLEANHRMLRIELRAARQVSEIISRAIEEGQSDGTYSASSWRE
jgi:hypothetical protein